MKIEIYKAQKFVTSINSFLKRTLQNVIGFYSRKKLCATCSHKNCIYKVNICASEHLKCASIIDRRGVTV